MCHGLDLNLQQPINNKSMPVTIIPITDHEVYKVNNHTVYKNTLGNWTCNVDLSNKELKGFEAYKQTIIEDPKIKKHPKSTYSG
jgi:hypothetical protein